MNKRDMLQLLEGLPDDTEIALWRYTDKDGSQDILLNPCVGNPRKLVKEDGSSRLIVDIASTGYVLPGVVRRLDETEKIMRGITRSLPIGYFTYTFEKQDGETTPDFLTRIANEIQTMSVKIYEFWISLDQAEAVISYTPFD